MPGGYRSEQCRAGGAMDERLAGAPWLAPPGPSMFDTATQASTAGGSSSCSEQCCSASSPAWWAGWLASIALGLAGAILGYLVFTVGLGIGDTDVFDWGGILSAIIGTVIVLLVVGFFVRRRGAPRV